MEDIIFGLKMAIFVLIFLMVICYASYSAKKECTEKGGIGFQNGYSYYCYEKDEIKKNKRNIRQRRINNESNRYNAKNSK